MKEIQSAAVRVLLVCDDSEMIDLLCDVMEQINVVPIVCPEHQAAAQRLRKSKYEGLIVDLRAGEPALRLLQSVPEFPSNKAIVSFAILHGANQKTAAFKAGANFVLARPLDRKTASRTLLAAYPLMVRERRRYLRHPVTTTVFVKGGHNPEFQATSINIAERGLAMVSPQPLEVGKKLQFRLSLSGKTEFLTLPGEVRWSDSARKSGVQFGETTELLAEALEAWLRENSKKCRTKRVPRSRR